MIVCPVCEHQQASGEECELCGKVFSKDMAIPVPIPPMEGLEPTALAVGPDGIAPPPTGDWVEPTALAPAQAGAEGEVPDLQPTRLAEPTAPSSLEMLPADRAAAAPDWLEATPLAPPEAETAVPEVAVCRYCRTPGQPGETICGRCGMRLPDWAPTAQEEDGVQLLCPSCGTPTRPGRCPSCGGQVNLPEA